MLAGGARQLPQPLALGAEHERERRAQRRIGEPHVAGAVEPDREIAALLQLGERAGEVLHRHQRNVFERAGS